MRGGLRGIVIAALGSALAIAGCSDGGVERGCTSSSECGDGVCVDRRCVAGTDAGRADAASADEDGGESALDAAIGLDAAMIDSDAGTTMGADGGEVIPPTADTDGDGISDLHEGRATAVDTDGDGAPDWMDPDSDGDGISDAVEAGDAVLTTPPIDSDFDGVPDFRDEDSDGNGVPDATEGALDRDGDTRPDFRDLDNDDDGLDDLIEIGPDPTAPIDTDGNGLADYNSPDSDGDLIADAYEALLDTDGDGTIDKRDLDSDGDGYTDLIEAGDTDLATDPVDTDADTIPDFRDPDSDNDGLSDARERTGGTSRTRADTDGDGVSDLIEVGAGTDPLSAADSPRTRGDFVFLEPYMLPPSPTRDTLQFATSLQRADVYFLVDTTGSMGGEIANLRSSLSSTIIPMVRSRIPEAHFGVGAFDDYPVAPYGDAASGDRPFYQLRTMTADIASAQAGVNALTTHYGYDWEESNVAALWTVATGTSLGYGSTTRSCAAGTIGMPCFRSDAVPVIVMITDAVGHNYPGFIAYGALSPAAPTYTATIAALTSVRARVVGINSGSDYRPADVRNFLLDVATRTGTVDAGGSAAPFVFDIPATGTGLGTAVVNAIYQAALVPLDVSASAVDIADPGETINAVTAFLDHLETRSTAAPGLTCTMGFTTVDRPGIDGDAFPDTFQRVTPGSPVCFDIIPRMNTTVMPTLDPQLFRARINVIGDGFTPLDTRIVYFLVPPRVPDPNE
ncbi:MAG: VWA domain-containing protein [Myxococcota bacterium]|nr:VWA domain-containing protein [Myxococcota bacterium]